MDLRLALFEAAKAAGLSTSLVGWRLDSGLSAQGQYDLSDLASAVDYHPSINSANYLSTGDVVGAWADYLLTVESHPAEDTGTFTATPDVTSITADGVDESVITLSPGGTYRYAVWIAGERVASGTVTDGTLEFSTTDAGAYTIRVIDMNATVKSVEITAS